MKLHESEYKKLPPHLQALFVKAPNPGSDEVLALFPETKSVATQGVSRKNGVLKYGGKNSRPSHNTSQRITDAEGYNDSGSAARFFYCSKASAKDRAGSKHPTVKPVSLMRWLVRMVCPPGGTILDPFAGSGTTGQAALEEGFRVTLIEREEEYRADIERRLAFCMEQKDCRNDNQQRDLFALQENE